MASHFAKLDKFEGVDFMRWQKKMRFLLSSMSVVYVLTTPVPEDVMEQYNELLGILGRFTQHKMNMDEAIQVSCIIDKLPPSWKDFKHTLKHKRNELTLVELGSHLRIEESLRAQDSDKPKGNNVVGPQLGHVHFKRMQDMSKDGLIPAFDMDTEKCKTCMLNKITKKPFQNVKRETEVLELIHSDLCDLHATPSLGNKKYFVTFIDDASRVVVRLPDPKLKTLGEKGIERIFVGYVEHSKAFRFYVIKPNESILINSIIESRDAIFDENRFSSVPRPSLSIPKGTEDISGSVVPEEVTEEDVAFWKEAINDETDSIMDNNTWVLADLPLGFKQKSRIDYFDTYALVARISTIRLLIAIALIHNLIIHQMDVKTAFLNGELDKEVYMNQPQGFIMLGNENKVCKLIKSLNGLKQAPKQWHQKFDEVVLSNGYLLNQADKCVYSKFDESGKGVIIFLYVDDMLIFGTNQVRIKHESNRRAISQSHYIKKVLKKFNYFDCTPLSTPIDTSEKLMSNNGQAVSQLEYSRVIDCLMYAMTCTRPEIVFIVGKLS
ncbi:zinc finger, CCHC-type containing protein, partial [Tanacetum coccineum]